MMSDVGGFNPSPSAWGKFGQTLENTAEYVYDTINKADAHSQYMQGMEMLRKGLIDFNNGLATDANPDGYLDKWNKSSDAIWKQSTAMIKNPDALGALKDQWEDMGIKQYETITGYQTQAKVSNTIDRTMDTIDKNSLDNTKGNQDRKDFNRRAMAPLISTGMVNGDAARKTLEQYDKKVDMSAMEEGLKQVARTEGVDYALGLTDNPDFTQFFPSLGQTEIDSVSTKLEARARFQEAQASKEDGFRNSDYASKLFDAYNNLREGKKGAISLEMISDPRGFSKTKDGQEWRKYFEGLIDHWSSEQRTAQRENRTEAKQRISDVSTSASNIIDSEDLDQASKKQQLMQLGRDNDIPQEAIKKWTDQAQTGAKNKGFQDMLSKVSALSQGTDAQLSKEQASQIRDTLTSIAMNDPKITITKLNDELQSMFDDASKENVKKVMDQLSSEMTLALPEQRQVQEPPANAQALLKETGRSGAPGVLDGYFTQHGLSVKSEGTNAQGVRMWLGSDGKHYAVSQGKLFVLSVDGSEWQTPQ